MCDLVNCSIGTSFIVYTEGKRLFGILTCTPHVAKAIQAIQARNNSDTKIIVEAVN